MPISLPYLSDEGDTDKIAVITAGNCEGYLPSATARRASRKASNNPPGMHHPLLDVRFPRYQNRSKVSFPMHP